MQHTLVLSFIFMFSSALYAQTFSAARESNEKSAIKIAELKDKARKKLGLTSQEIVMELAQPLNKASLTAITQWPSYSMIEESFYRLRDARFLPDPDHPGQLRRESWLYPDDGCFARAALMNQNLEAWSVQPVTKIFVFGDLEVQTSNSEYGAVYWWFHVAPIVTDGQEKYVIDPAIEPSHPIKLADWLDKMGGQPDFKIAICNSYAYLPDSLCLTAPQTDDDIAHSDQMLFLPLEYERLLSLGRDPQEELGSHPPWLQ